MLKEQLPEWYRDDYVPEGPTPTWDEIKVGDIYVIKPFLLTEERIRKYVFATQDTHPVYLDEKTAAQSQFGGLIAPPTIVIPIIFASVPPNHWIKTNGAINPKQILVFGVPVRAGDVISGSVEVKDKYIKRGKKYLESYQHITNQNGELVCGCTGWAVLPR